MGANDFQWGATNSIPQYNFGGTNYGGYGAMSQYGQPSPTMGAGAPSPDILGNTITDGAQTPGLFSGSGFGMNIPTLQLGLGGLSTLSNLYGGLKSLGLAQDQFNFQKQLSQTNLANSTQSYNTQLSDKATARGVTEGQSAATVQDYINKNKLAG